MPKSSSIFCRQIGASRILWAAAIVVSSTAGSVRAEAPEQPAQTFELSPEVEAILKALDEACAPGFREGLAGLVNPYGDGHASEAIAKVLASVEWDDACLIKEAVSPVAGLSGL